MSKILFFSPSDNITDIATAFKASLSNPNNFVIMPLAMEAAINYLNEHKGDDVDVIIARGNTATMLKAAKVDIPLVPLSIADYEIVESIKYARHLYKERSNQIGYVGMDESIRRMKSLLNFNEYNIRIYPISNSLDIRDQVAQAKADGLSVLIGGKYTAAYAKSQGLHCVQLKSSLKSISESYENALEVQRKILSDKYLLLERDAILKSILEGVICVNENGIITLINKVAENYLENADQAYVGRHYSHFLGGQEAHIETVLNGSAPFNGIIAKINDITFSIYINPITIGKTSKGAVITIKSLIDKYAEEIDAKEKYMDSLINNSIDAGIMSVQSNEFIGALRLANLFAPLQNNILIIGESGTGKKTFAEHIHRNSLRRNEPFVSCHGKTFSPDHIEKSKNGTLYIAEIEDLPPVMQDYLEDIITLWRNPATRVDDINVRVIASCSTDLLQYVKSGVFRRSLYHKLNQLILSIPSLHNRGDDVLMLFKNFISSYSAAANININLNDLDELSSYLLEYPWPGNIAELQSLCQRLSVFLIFGIPLSASLLQEELSEARYFNPCDDKTVTVDMSECLDSAPGIIIHGKKISFSELNALKRSCNNHQNLMAEKLGVSRTTLWRYLKVMDEYYDGKNKNNQ